MTPERWQQIQDVFERVSEAPEPQRAQLLAETCGDDDALRDEVESLLAADRDSTGFIETPALGERVPLVDPELVLSDAQRYGLSHVGPYKLIRPIAAGGMGAVYLAQREGDPDARPVAIKLLRPVVDRQVMLQRFARERQLLAGLHHPHIARLLDGGATEQGLPYLAMEYVEGRPIDEYCEQRRLGVEERLRLFVTVCSAVSYAHHNLIVHCDLKPNNILVTAAGEPKLLDFGIARLVSDEGGEGRRTTTAAVLMTPDYASPEQICGEPITTAADVYSLGVVLYELLAGVRPFRRKGLPRYELARLLGEQEAARPSAAVTGEKHRRTASAASGTHARADDSRARIAGLGHATPTGEQVGCARPDESGLASPTLHSAEERRSSPHRLAHRLRGDLDTIVLKALRREPERRYSSVEHLAEDIERHLAGQPILARKDELRYRMGKFIARYRGSVTAAALIALSLIAGIIGTAWQARSAAAQRDRAEEQRRAAEANLARALDAELRCALEADVASTQEQLASMAAAQAQAVNAFLQSMLGSVDPVNEGENATVLQVLDKAAGRVHAELAGQPLVEATVRQTLGNAYHSLGMYEPAERQFRAALDVQWREMGAGEPGDETLARMLKDLAELLRDRGEYKPARQTFEQALAIFRARLGTAHVETVATTAALGTLLHEMGDFSAAEPLCREAVAAYLRLLRAEMPIGSDLGVADVLNNLGSVLQYTGDLEAAEPLYRRALAIRRELLRSDHPHVADSLNNLASLLLARGDAEGAAGLCAEALEMRIRTLPAGHPAIAATQYLYAQCLLQLRDPAGAESLARECLEIRRHALGDVHWLTAEAESLLGAALTGLGGSGAAERRLLASYPKLRTDCGETHERTLETAQRIVQLFEATDRAGEAGEYREVLRAASAQTASGG